MTTSSLTQGNCAERPRYPWVIDGVETKLDVLDDYTLTYTFAKPESRPSWTAGAAPRCHPRAVVLGPVALAAKVPRRLS